MDDSAKEIARLINEATSPESSPSQKQESFQEIVKRFQDLAYACAYAVLRDFWLAEDVAQDSFITAWQKLDQLRKPEAFPGWFRRIVLNECHRLTRGKKLQFVPFESGLTKSAIGAVASRSVTPSSAQVRPAISAVAPRSSISTSRRGLVSLGSPVDHNRRRCFAAVTASFTIASAKT